MEVFWNGVDSLFGRVAQVIHKQHPSSFTGTDLSEHLEKVGKKKIVLAGKSHEVTSYSLI